MSERHVQQEVLNRLDSRTLHAVNVLVHYVV